MGPMFLPLVRSETGQLKPDSCRSGSIVQPNPRSAKVPEFACQAPAPGPADIIRLLPFTGYRNSEIKNLRWFKVDGDTLRLIDSKTVPRTVYPDKNARAFIDRQQRGSHLFVFPSPGDPGRPYGANLRLWYLVRERPGLSSVRLLEYRLFFASQAVMKGVPLPVVARLPSLNPHAMHPR